MRTLAFLLLLAGSGARAQHEAQVWLEGDSTMHAYHSTATVVNLDVELAEGPGFGSGAVRRLVVEIPVEKLRSGSDKLDSNMQDAMDADKHPNIRFELRSYALDRSTEPAVARVQGELTVAGKTLPVDLEARGRTGPGTAEFEGEKRLKMTDFGIKPPKMFLGALKTRNEVDIRYRITLRRERP